MSLRYKTYPISEVTKRQTPVIVYLTYDLPICKETIFHPSFWPMTVQSSVTWSDILHSDQDVAQPVEYIWSALVEIDEILSGFIWTIYTLHRPESDLIIIHLESSKFINSQLTAVIIFKW